MDLLITLTLYSVAIVGVSLIGGSLPLIYQWSSDQLHLFTGLSAGFFIAAAFIILIPESIELMDAHGALISVMIGLVAILFLERVILANYKPHPKREYENVDEHQQIHILTSATAFAGLVVHGAMEGLALGVASMVGSETGMMVFIAIIAHEGFEVLALATTFRLAEFSTKRSMILVASFSLIVPIMAFAAIPLMNFLNNVNIGIPIAIAAGTFLYVGVCDLLPEAFHLEKKGYRAFLIVILGIFTMYVIDLLVGCLH
ncbi:MAG: ZIP family metal transporter [Euryarchaeota archaeon]|mgnify:CR=1 FL=1|nr:ZIP family metal transporter [Euryarchaeota archaeon]